MKVPLTKRQAEVLAFLRAQITQHGYAPTLDEIARHLKLRSLATVSEHLQTLERKGHIRRWHYDHRAIELVKDEPVEAGT